MLKKEYIERDSVLRSLAVLLQMPFTDLDDAWEVIQKTPAADVVEVVHGEWLPVSDDDQYEGEYHCSRCNAEEFIPDRSPFPPYCWQCGARMDGATDTNVGGKRKEKK